MTRSRARLVDAFEAERRRIERDLHDGAQQHLVALTMALGLARFDAAPGPLADQLTKAHEEAGKALAGLRELIHGIYPKVLTDYGLQAAVSDAADRCVVPVDVDLQLPGRSSQPVESAAYFAVCEALANVARHSGANRARVSGGHRDGRLFLEVRDNGRGGADPSTGSGLTGLADRVSVLNGRLALTSPPGGPHPSTCGVSLRMPEPPIAPRSAGRGQRAATGRTHRPAQPLRPRGGVGRRGRAGAGRRGRGACPRHRGDGRTHAARFPGRRAARGGATA